MFMSVIMEVIRVILMQHVLMCQAATHVHATVDSQAMASLAQVVHYLRMFQCIILSTCTGSSLSKNVSMYYFTMLMSVHPQ